MDIRNLVKGNSMKIVVIGLGSMGKRRIRLIKEILPSAIIYGIDINPDRRSACEIEMNIKTTDSLSNIIDDGIDCAFVCTSPLSHSQIINHCLYMGLHVFTELNLITDGYDENTQIANEKNLVLFISSTFLYRAETRFIINQVHNADYPLNYIYHVGQYLPDWHPWEDYQNFFVGDKKTNGCREIFAIELPWLIEAFGPITNIQVQKGIMSDLKIDYCDNYIVIAEHQTGHKGVLAVDVVSRKAVRNFEVFGRELYIYWNGTPEGLYLYDFEIKRDNNINLYNNVYQIGNYSRFIVENAYLNEIKAFFSAINNEEQPIYDFKKDKEVLSLIDRIEA